MSPDVRVQFLRWRNDCIAHHNAQQNPRRPHGRPMGAQRRNEAQPNGAPRWVNVAATTGNTNSTPRGFPPLSSEFESDRPRNAAEGNNPPFHVVQPNAPPFHIRELPQPIPPPPMPQTIDPEWLREVSLALGPEGVTELQKKQFRIMHAQNNPNKRGFRHPQIIRAPPPPPPPVPIPFSVDPGQMAEFTSTPMMRTVQGRRRSTPNPR